MLVGSANATEIVVSWTPPTGREDGTELVASELQKYSLYAVRPGYDPAGEEIIPGTNADLIQDDIPGDATMWTVYNVEDWGVGQVTVALTVTDTGDLTSKGSESATAEFLYSPFRPPVLSTVTYTVPEPITPIMASDEISTSVKEMGTFNVPGDKLSIVGWVKANSFTVTDARILSKASGVKTQEHIFMLSSANDYDGGTDDILLRARLRTDGNTDTYYGPKLDLDTWHHVGLVYDGRTVKLYLDGIKVLEETKTGNIAQSGDSVWIGDNPPTLGSRPWDGSLGYVRVYDSVLTSTEVNRILAETRP